MGQGEGGHLQQQLPHGEAAEEQAEDEQHVIGAVGQDVGESQSEELGELRSTCTRKLEKRLLALGWHLPQVATTFCLEMVLSGFDCGRILW